MKIKTIIFDLDNTLAKTDSLEDIRLAHDLYGMDEAINNVQLFPKTLKVLDHLKSIGLPLGLVSNSPRWYVDKFLDHFDLTKYFEVVLTYTETSKINGVKPSGLGIIEALRQMGIPPHKDVLYIGDDAKDILASYDAGVTPIVPSWASRVPVAHMPAAVLSTDFLIESLDDLEHLGLIAELCATKKTFDFPKKQLNFIPLDRSGNVITLSNDLATLCFGRYFTKQSPTSYNYHKTHPLSLEIISKEHSDIYSLPTYMVDLLEHAINKIPETPISQITHFDIVTVIPSKPHKPNKRLENFLKNISDKFVETHPHTKFIDDLFYFDDGTQDSKTLRYEERIIELESRFHFNKKYHSLIKGANILVIDDVITTGSTLKTASDLLSSFEPNRVLNICLAKTVSITERKECPSCHSLMSIRTNSHTQIDFWGCRNRACTHTEDIKIKDCPHCKKPMTLKLSRRNQYFLSCTGYYDSPKCTHSESYNV